MAEKIFNMIIAGIGGQGTLKLGEIISQAALLQGYDVKNCSLHGLAQRFGAVKVYIRIGKKVYSPLVKAADADLVIGLEPVEALRACYYASGKTKFLVDTRRVVPVYVHLQKKPYPALEEISKQINKFSGNIVTANATEEAERISGISVAANIYLLGAAIAKNMMPVKKEHALEAMKQIFSEKTFEINKNVFEAGFSSK